MQIGHIFAILCLIGAEGVTLDDIDAKLQAIIDGNLMALQAGIDSIQSTADTICAKADALQGTGDIIQVTSDQIIVDVAAIATQVQGIQETQDCSGEDSSS